MSEIIDMPKLSDTMETGTLVKWLKNEGDTVTNGDVLAEVETDKATMELECFSEGVVLKQYIKSGESVSVGTAIIAIGEKGEEVPEVNESAPASTSSDQESKEKTSQTEAAEQSSAEKSESTEKKKSSAESSSAEEASQNAPSATSDSGSSTRRVKVSPLARKLAERKNIPIEHLQGSGPGGRIIKKDILAAEEQGVAAASTPTGQAGGKETTVAEADPAALQQITEPRQEPVTNMRGAIARRLLESKTTIPHFYLEAEVDSAPLGRMRKSLNNALADFQPQEGGAKFTVNDLILKASTEALRRVPGVNSSWGEEYIQHHGAVHIAFGVAVEEGLVTPVIRDAQQKSLRQISSEAKILIQKARKKNLKPEEMSGSTFTVTNLGMFGISRFYGIINPPNAGILSVGAPIKQPVVDENGQIVAGERMSLGFSGDHRVVDGATGAQFLGALKNILETPESLLV